MTALAPLFSLSFKAACNRRLFLLIAGLGLLLTVFILMMATISLDQNERIVSDFILAGVPLLLILISIVTGAYLTLAEQERGTSLLIFSRPISKGQFVVAKFLGLAGAVTVYLLLVSVITIGLASFVYHLPIGALALALYTSLLEVYLLIAAVTFMATVSTPIIAAVLTVGVFIIGHQLDLIYYAARASGPVATWLGTALYYLLPNLEKYNVREMYDLAPTLPGSFYGWATLYAFVYIGLWLTLATLTIKHREW